VKPVYRINIGSLRGAYLPAIVLGPCPRGILLDPLVGTEGITLYGLKRVRAGARRNRKIEPQGFVAGYSVSASAQIVVRISYVHAGTKVFHFAKLLEVHRVFWMWEGLVDFTLQVLITSCIAKQVVKYGGQRCLDRIGACDDGEGAIGEDIRNGGPLPFRLAIIDLGHDLSVINRDR